MHVSIAEMDNLFSKLSRNLQGSVRILPGQPDRIKFSWACDPKGAMRLNRGR
jgi:hypothetical protein